MTLPASFEDPHNLTVRVPGMLQRPHGTLVSERVGASGSVPREVVASFGFDAERLGDDGEQLLGALGGLQDLDDEEAARHAGQDTTVPCDGCDLDGATETLWLRSPLGLNAVHVHRERPCAAAAKAARGGGRFVTLGRGR